MLVGLLLFPLISAVPAAAQTAKQPAGTRQQSSTDALARKQLPTYLAVFQHNPDDAVMRQKIVTLAKSLNPAPAIPEIAQDTFTQATARMNAAASADDFKAAAKLFEQAAVEAPWFYDADYSAGSACVKAGDFDGASRNLALYLEAVRPGADDGKGEALRRDIDRRQSELQFQTALKRYTANPNGADRQQIIKLVQTMKTPPEIPEAARGHYVTATVLMNSADENPGYEQRAIDEYKAALLAAPWWGDAYKKLATAQTTTEQYEDAIASLNNYMLTQPSDARGTQDEIYRLKALELRAADEQAKKQTEDQQRKLLMEKNQKEHDAINNNQLTLEGTWYDDSTPKQFFAGGKAEPDCDYSIRQSGGRWSIANHCSKSKRSIDRIEVQPRQISFRLTGHGADFPYSEVDITFTLSPDGQTLDGRGTYYDKSFFAAGYYSVRWQRRE
jgi:hypothetical protein